MSNAERAKRIAERIVKDIAVLREQDSFTVSLTLFGLERIILSELPPDGWISLKERRPETGLWCWVVCNGHTQKMAAQLAGKGFACKHGYEWRWADEDADPAPFDVVTHWQPMIQPPQREGIRASPGERAGATLPGMRER